MGMGCALEREVENLRVQNQVLMDMGCRMGRWRGKGKGKGVMERGVGCVVGS